MQLSLTGYIFKETPSIHKILSFPTFLTCSIFGISSEEQHAGPKDRNDPKFCLLFNFLSSLWFRCPRFQQQPMYPQQTDKTRIKTYINTYTTSMAKKYAMALVVKQVLQYQLTMNRMKVTTRFVTRWELDQSSGPLAHSRLLRSTSSKPFTVTRSRPLPRSLPSLPVRSLSSARREPKVFWSRPPSRRCWPPPAPRGSLRPPKPALATAPSWTLTLGGSPPESAAPLPRTPRRHDTARVAPRSANANLCTSLTWPTKTPFLIPLWTSAPSLKGAEPFSPPCTDWATTGQIGWKDCEACMQ